MELRAREKVNAIRKGTVARDLGLMAAGAAFGFYTFEGTSTPLRITMTIGTAAGAPLVPRIFGR